MIGYVLGPFDGVDGDDWRERILPSIYIIGSIAIDLVKFPAIFS
jgi:hypothetical protein